MSNAAKDFFADFEVNIPSEEELRAERNAAYAWTRERLIDPADILTRAPGADAAQLNLLSLPAWLAVAQRAGINHIPARLLADLDAETYIEVFDAPEGAAADAYSTFHNQILNDLAEDEMVRMEQVAPRDIKGLMSQGLSMSSGLIDMYDGGRYLDLHEDRFYVTFKDLGADRVRAYARPIVTPAMIDGCFRGENGRWPAEFRVYVESGRVVGISNYYPQVTMDPDQFREAARDAYAAAQAMLNTMNTLHLGVGGHSLCPDRGPKDVMEQTPDWMPNIWGPQSFTLDFMVLDTGEITFLEGGPAGLSSAHPCCFFQEGREVEPDYLHGVAWSDTDPITPLSDLI
jgi:hypothetical protein